MADPSKGTVYARIVDDYLNACFYFPWRDPSFPVGTRSSFLTLFLYDLGSSCYVSVNITAHLGLVAMERSDGSFKKLTDLV